MFITEEESDNILNNPHNLANRFKNGKEVRRISYADSLRSSVIDGEEYATPTKDSEVGTEEGPPEIPRQGIHEESIQHREIKRPGNNRPWLSKSVRTRIAADVASSPLNGNQTRTQIAQKYGVQVSTVSDIANNVRRVPDSARSVEQEKVDLALDAVREKAIDKLMAGLGQITEEKVQAHNAKDISVICANMARVVQQTIPQEKTAQQINLVVYTPELRAEKNFDVVEI